MSVHPVVDQPICHRVVVPCFAVKVQNAFATCNAVMASGGCDAVIHLANIDAAISIFGDVGADIAFGPNRLCCPTGARSRR